MDLTCVVCGKLFVSPSKRKRKTCSPECLTEARASNIVEFTRQKVSTNILRDCGHCGKAFTVLKSKSHQRRYCSRKCYKLATEAINKEKLDTKASQACYSCGKTGVKSRGLCNACYQHDRMWKPINVQVNTCPICDCDFRTPKAYNRKYCSTECYVKSEPFKKARERFSSEMESRRIDMVCLHCGKSMRVAPGKMVKQVISDHGVTHNYQRLFCSRPCYRKYYSARFDRWAETSASLDLKGMSWDEFLSQEVLPCPIVGCDWAGDHLGIHANAAHGVTAAELKEALGFNRHSGLMSTAATEKRRALSIKQEKGNKNFGELAQDGPRKWTLRPEGQEHLNRANALRRGDSEIS